MTVKELIAKLSELDGDKEIVVHNAEGASIVEISRLTDSLGLEAYAIDGQLTEGDDLIYANADGLNIHYGELK